ncbi:cd5a1669-0874-4a7a-b7c4-cb63ff471841 [Sclerotinia trifoliorum]|uniref:Cd5a1669-0874-4a7a-b7c4-cb63ff471841 n=1 Tax=Sclerotinia trifoliorum TaxID=28548 RepID=A0A8H2ZMG6_9HELO|nr:cd5a1669-0874-4a7a-b7c4-cb63ff471841 [Sclerotinia trifoliorum]
MASDNLSYSTMDPPFFQENRSNPQSFRHEDLMDIENSWMENIDPLLRQAQIVSPDFDYQQDLPQQPLQRFITEQGRAFFTTDATMAHFDNFSRPLPRAFEPVGVFPQDSRTRMISPSPSQGLSSSCSSARSPGTETDWYHDGLYSSQGQKDYNLPLTSHATPAQMFTNIWTQSHTQPLQPVGYPCVNLSDVQAFADPQDVKFEVDESYTIMDMPTDYAIQTSESGTHKLASHISHYRDEGLGASIRDAASPRAVSTKASNNDNTSTTSDADADADVDAEGEVDVDVDTNVEMNNEAEIDPELLPSDIEEEAEEEEEPSDTEYTPRPSTRNPRKRNRTNKSIPPSHTKRNRISKPLSTSKSSKISLGNLSCKQCTQTGFKDPSTLQHHIASSHTRAFICVFDFAGCSSTFASKNEWKRHVSSQHLNLQAWVCTLGACGKIPLSSHSSSMRKVPGRNIDIDMHGGENAKMKMVQRGYEVKGAEFNRKDLFTQHLRRMHAPFEVKRKGQINREWEERMRGLQRSCEKVRREAPSRLGCPVTGCTTAWFEGIACWDERMEHLGKHLERLGGGGGGGGERMTIGTDSRIETHNHSTHDQYPTEKSTTNEPELKPRPQKINHQNDPLFLEWAAQQKIIERSHKGEWKLCAGITRNGSASASGSGWGKKRCVVSARHGGHAGELKEVVKRGYESVLGELGGEGEDGDGDEDAEGEDEDG